MQLSIIVPVYNVEQYLPRCIDSLLRQGLVLDEHEIILVDDGSTDASGAICDQYASQHGQISVIHKENGGLSSARNKGLLQAQGDYVAFVDSDDFIADNALFELLRHALAYKVEVVLGNALMLDTHGFVTPKIAKRATQLIVEDGVTMLVNSMSTATYSACAVLGLYNRTFLISNSLFFEDGIFCEDELWTPQVYLKSNRMIYVDLDFYFHCVRPGSITNREDKYDLAQSLLIVVNKLILILETAELPHKHQRCIEDYMCMLYLSGFYVGRCYRGDRRAYIDRKLPLRLAYSRKNKIKALLFAISPSIYYLINRTCKMLGKAS